MATKADKVKSSKRPARKVALAEALGLERSEVTWVSARTGNGIDVLQARVMDLLTA